MAETFQLDLVTPDRMVASVEAKQVTVPGQEGFFGVLPGHAPFLSALNPGLVVIGEGPKAKRFAVSGGFAEVLPDRVTLLLDQAETAGQRTPDQIQQDIEEARLVLAGTKPEEELAYARAQTRLAFAEVCLALAESQYSQA